jgi:predicted acyl esterase
MDGMRWSLEEIARCVRHDLERTPGVLSAEYDIELTGPSMPGVPAWREVDMRVEMRDGTRFRIQISEEAPRKP